MIIFFPGNEFSRFHVILWVYMSEVDAPFKSAAGNKNEFLMKGNLGARNEDVYLYTCERSFTAVPNDTYL